MHIDLETLVVRLVDPSELAGISVVVDSPAGATELTHGHRLADVVAHRHVGALDESGAVAVDQSILRFLAAGEVEDGWEQSFDEAVERAAVSGALDPTGRLLALVVWPRA